MQMHIRHETRYRYERPVKYSVQSLHLTPRRDLSQRALTWTITAPGRRLEQVDAYGNISHLLTIEEPHREITSWCAASSKPPTPKAARTTAPSRRSPISPPP
jgi:transglutaminase-like putative cysteine protease